MLNYGWLLKVFIFGLIQFSAIHELIFTGHTSLLIFSANLLLVIATSVFLLMDLCRISSLLLTHEQSGREISLTSATVSIIGLMTTSVVLFYMIFNFIVTADYPYISETVKTMVLILYSNLSAGLLTTLIVIFSNKLQHRFPTLKDFLYLFFRAAMLALVLVLGCTLTVVAFHHSATVINGDTQFFIAKFLIPAVIFNLFILTAFFWYAL